MPAFNKVILAGHLTRDPELTYLQSGTPVCDFGLGINRSWTDKASGEKKEEATFVDCASFGKQAEVITQYLHKGDPFLIEGRLKLEQWEANDGTKRSKLRVVVESFTFLGSRKEAESQEQPQRKAAERPASRRSVAAVNGKQSAAEKMLDSTPEDQDIPF